MKDSILGPVIVFIGVMLLAYGVSLKTNQPEKPKNLVPTAKVEVRVLHPVKGVMLTYGQEFPYTVLEPPGTGYAVHTKDTTFVFSAEEFETYFSTN